MQNISHCTETLPPMPLANFSHFVSLATYIVLGVVQCKHTTNVNNKQLLCHFFKIMNICILFKDKCKPNHYINLCEDIALQYICVIIFQ